MSLPTWRKEFRAVLEGVSAVQGKGCRGVGVPGDQARSLCVSGAGERTARTGSVLTRGKVVFKE